MTFNISSALSKFDRRSNIYLHGVLDKHIYKLNMIGIFLFHFFWGNKITPLLKNIEMDGLYLMGRVGLMT